MIGRGTRTTVAVLALAALAAGGLAACSSNVLHGLDERAANDAVTALGRAGIGAEKIADDDAMVGVGGGGGGPLFAVRVARADGGRALDLLRAAGLPRDRRRGFAETYGQPSLIPTASEERARYLEALSGEIERTLESVDGVVTARVHLVPEATDALGQPAATPDPRGAARAAVLLKARPGRAPLAEDDVRRLVAGSVAGLDPAAVAVVTTAAAEPGGDAQAAATALASFGPLRVSPESRGLLASVLGTALALLAALAALLLLTGKRLAALEHARRQEAQAATATATAAAQRKT